MLNLKIEVLTFHHFSDPIKAYKIILNLIYIYTIYRKYQFFTKCTFTKTFVIYFLLLIICNNLIVTIMKV